jgi:hypothetical protein
VCSIKPTLILAYICCTPLYTLNQSTTFPVPYLLSWYPFEFLNATDVVPAPIGPLHKFLPAGTFGATSAPAGPSVTMLGAPPMPLAPADDPLAPALYIPPVLRAPGPLPRHARRPPALLSRATRSLGRAQHVWRRPTSPAVRPACASRGLDVSSTDRELPSASVASSGAPRAPPRFPPLRPKRDFTYHYTRWTASATQGCCCCPSSDQPTRHGNAFEERLSDARCVPRCIYVAGA